MANREILFRGKCTDTGRWYEGQYIHLHKTTYCFKEDYDRNPDNDIHQIVFEEMMDWGLPNRHLRADVLPETVGQYTGLTDKNGKKIFEGDICRFREWSKGDMCWIGKIHYEHQQFVISGEKNKECESPFLLVMSRFTSENIEVVGNIHDNPELIKGGAE
jgi:uncharacterized phage protein (TIGR01671 family)